MGLSRRQLAAGILALGAGAPLAARAEPASTPGAQTLPGRKDRTSRLTTPVRINGTGPYAFVVDTGANRSVMAAELAAELGLPPGRATRIHGILGLQDAQTVNARSFTAGGLRLPVADVPILRREDLGCDGFLGLDAFRDRSVAFDFRRAQVSILPARFEDIEEGHPAATLSSDIVVRARQRLGQLTIADAFANGQRISCFIDSGAQLSVGNTAMRQAVRAGTPGAGLEPATVQLYGATGQQTQGEVAEVPKLAIGALRFARFAMAFADLHTFSLWGMQDRPAMMMGMDLLNLFELVLVDFQKNTVRFRMAEMVRPPLLA
jgi:predicted aspartyl protease